MNILFLATQAFGMGGGIAAFNRNFLTSISKNLESGEIDLISLFNRSSTKNSYEGSNNFKSRSGSKFRFFLDVILSIQSKHQVIVCGHINFLPAAYFLACCKRVPLVLIVHGVDAWDYCGSSLRTWLVRRVCLIVTVSEFTISRMKRNVSGSFPEHFVLPNAVDLNSFYPGDKRQDLVDRFNVGGCRVVLFLGRLDSNERYKGVDELIEAMADLASVVPPIKLLVAGSGSDQVRLEKKVRELNLSSNVCFTGYVESEILPDLYRLADVFAMPGYGEGFGIVYLEAMASGVPVIGSVWDGSKEALMHGELGVLVDPANREQLLNALRKQLLAGTGERPAKITHFSMDAFDKRVKLLMNTIVELIEVKAPR